MSEEIKIELLASDFKDSRYINVSDCPLARGVRRALPNITGISVGTSRINIYGVGRYELSNSQVYNARHYATDRDIAKDADPETVIRTLYIQSI